jgi:predicted lipoprotein with Yx(FWY)xxD motif
MERAATRLGAAVAMVALFGAVAAIYAVRAIGASHVHVVATANNVTLGKKILVNAKGMTLYSLSVERKGRFICTGSTCLSVWKPLTIMNGAIAVGAAHLTVVKRARRAPSGRLSRWTVVRVLRRQASW